MDITSIPLDCNNRMIRIGFDKNKGNWFFQMKMVFRNKLEPNRN